MNKILNRFRSKNEPFDLDQKLDEANLHDAISIVSPITGFQINVTCRVNYKAVLMERCIIF